MAISVESVDPSSFIDTICLKEIRFEKSFGLLQALSTGARLNTQLAVDFMADNITYLENKPIYDKIEGALYERPIVALT